jgi:hypothetical protein
MGALRVIEELETTTDETKRKQLVFELGQHVASFDASKNTLDRDAKLKALDLIDELR